LKDQRNNFWENYWKQILFCVVLTIFIPILIGIVIKKTPVLAFSNGDVNGWLGFLGSFLGGIIGTGGVIYVAYLQNKEQTRSLKNVEKNNRERLYIEWNLNNIHDYLKQLSSLSKTINIYEYNRNLYLNYIINNHINNTPRNYEEFKNIEKENFKSFDIEQFIDSFTGANNNDIEFLYNEMVKYASELLDKIEYIEMKKKFFPQIETGVIPQVIILHSDLLNYHKNDIIKFYKAKYNEEKKIYELNDIKGIVKWLIKEEENVKHEINKNISNLKKEI